MTDKINKTKENIKKALMFANTEASEEDIEVTASGYGSFKQTNKCPRCKSFMISAKLSDGKQIYYCTSDRVAIPKEV